LFLGISQRFRFALVGAEFNLLGSGFDMSDTSKLSNRKLAAIYDKLQGELNVSCKILLSDGLGSLGGDEIRKLADNGDRSAMRYVRALNAFEKVAVEKSARRMGGIFILVRRLLEPCGSWDYSPTQLSRVVGR
jgi:hypothetical protein